MTKQLILSSTSPARRELLSRLQIPFTCTAPDIDESPRAGESIDQLIQRLAEEKALASAKQFPDAVIIGADSVGVINQQILCKPLTHENAVKILCSVSGNEVKFLTAVCVYDAHTKQKQIAVEEYDVFFRHLTDAMIENYLAKEDSLQCAGSFHAEGLGIALIEKFSGDDYTTLIGLPLIRLTEMLKQAGILAI